MANMSQMNPDVVNAVFAQIMGAKGGAPPGAMPPGGPPTAPGPAGAPADMAALDADANSEQGEAPPPPGGAQAPMDPQSIMAMIAQLPPPIQQQIMAAIQGGGGQPPMTQGQASPYNSAPDQGGGVPDQILQQIMGGKP